MTCAQRVLSEPLPSEPSLISCIVPTKVIGRSRSNFFICNDPQEAIKTAWRATKDHGRWSYLQGTIDIIKDLSPSAGTFATSQQRPCTMADDLPTRTPPTDDDIGSEEEKQSQATRKQTTVLMQHSTCSESREVFVSQSTKKQVNVYCARLTCTSRH
ncbi:transmembrane transport [Ascochyta rabiei]|uniref:Transmembrane transport n=1 Tax=Didymella rabiei TaxID=5454 RepID=A0A162YK27_DIDRA|nr:transmembrane transport [Ascochyta rabiei]